MKHVFFALFDTPSQALAAMDAVRKAGIPEADCGFLVHEHAIAADGEVDLTRAPIEETDTRESIIEGVLIGGLGGAVTLFLAALPLGWFAAGPLVGALVGLIGGSALGGMAGGIAGLDVPDRTVAGWKEELEAGKTLVTCFAHGRAVEQTVEEIFRDHRAREVRKRLI